MPHLVHGAVAVADPLVRIGVGAVGRGVVVPRLQRDDGALRQQRRRVVGIDVAVVPVEVEVADAAQHLLRPVGQDRGHLHALAPQVHVRLVVLDAAVLLQHVEVLGRGDGVGGNREVVAAALDGRPRRQHLPVLRLLPLGIEVQPELGGVGDLLADGRVVDVPHDGRAGLDELAAALAHDLALLADRPLHQDAGADFRGGAEVLGVLLLLQAGEGVVGDAATGHRRRPDLDGADPPVLGQPRRHFGLPPGVLRDGGHGVRRRVDDQVRRPAEEPGVVPDIVVGEHRGRRQVGEVALRRAGVDPTRDGVDLGLGQRPVVLEGLDAHRLVDVPGRHLPGLDAVPDGARPRPRVGVGLQRHRRDVARPVAVLALGPEDRGHVPGVGGGGVGLGGRHGRHQHQAAERERQGAANGACSRHHCCSSPLIRGRPVARLPGRGSRHARFSRHEPPPGAAKARAVLA